MPVQRYRHLPLWGQFLNRHGALSPEKAQPFSQRMAAAANLQGLISCFALQPLSWTRRSTSFRRDASHQAARLSGISYRLQAANDVTCGFICFTTPVRSANSSPKATRVTTLHTHYDNLKVAHDASPAAIDAAYQAMVRRFGPGQHPDDPAAAHKMSIIKASYAVLSDPHQRALHDLWVAQNDYEETVPPVASSIPALWMHSEAPQHYHQTPTRPQPLPLESTLPRQRRPHVRTTQPRPRAHGVEAPQGQTHLRRNWSLYALGAVVAGLALVTALPKPFLGDDMEAASAPASGPLRGFSVPVFFAPQHYTRPATAPNGQPWPASAGYVSGYPLLATGGVGSITVDNSRNDSDTFVKLVAQGNGVQPQVVRHIYVPAQQSFTVDQLPPGDYDLRYRNLATGALARTPAVSVTVAAPQALPEDGSQPPPQPSAGVTPVTVALYKEPPGKRPILRLAEKEFF